MTVVNRLPFPVMQLSKNDGTPAVGWTLTFYLSGTSTLANVYTAVDLSGPTNAIVLNAYGMPDVDIFLDPDVNYKLVIADDAGAAVFTYNNVRDFARRAVAHFTIYAGNPNGNVAGTAGVVGGTPADAIFDTTNGIIWICTTTGTAGTAVWTNVSSALSGAVTFSGVLTPPSFSTQQDNYNPTDLAISSSIRLNPGADCDMTGLAGGANGREITLLNINATFQIRLRNQHASSSSGNKFLLPSGADVMVLPRHTCVLRYDSISGSWYLKGAPVGLLPAGITAQRPSAPTAGVVRFNSTTGLPEWYDGTLWVSANVLPRGYIDGCIISNGTDATNDINVAAGACRDSTNAINITVAAMTKQLDANWAAGTNQGMRNSAAAITDTTYHIYAVAKADGTQDIYAHTSATIATVLAALHAESGGTDYVYARLIASIIRSGGTILAFTQDGDEFLLTTAVANITNTAPGDTNAHLVTLTVPLGLKLGAVLSVTTSSGTMGVYVSSPDQSDQAPSTADAPGVSMISATGAANGGARLDSIRTNTSGQVRYRATANSVMTVVTLGWRHPRGKNA